MTLVFLVNQPFDTFQMLPKRQAHQNGENENAVLSLNPKFVKSLSRWYKSGFTGDIYDW